MQLFIENNNKLYFPSVLDGVKWTTERKGTPGVLTFSVIKDEALAFTEGNSISFQYDDEKVFYGFVFSKKRTKANVIEVTAYDQLRYLKNKDTYTYENKKASEVIKLLAADFNLQVGEIEDTQYVIPSRDEDNQTLFDIINTALTLTTTAKGLLYTMYDDHGKLTLKSMENMTLDILICNESGEDFDYSSSIDTNTYNRIKIIYNSDSLGNREVFVEQSDENVDKWGVLQYYESISGDSNTSIEQIKASTRKKATTLLHFYNTKTRSLSFKNLFGDTRVRAGSRVYVHMNLGDIVLKNYMLVNRVTHTYNKDSHFMDLDLLGGGIYGQ